MEPALQTTSTLRHSYVEQGRRESTARIACLATRTDIFLLTSIPFIPYGKTSSSAMSVPWQTSFFVFFTSWPIVLPPKLLLLFPFEPPRRELTPGLHLLSYQSVGWGGSAGRSGNLSPRFSHVLGAELRAFPHPRTRCSTNQPSHLSRNLHFPFIPVPSSVGGTSSLRGCSGLCQTPTGARGLLQIDSSRSQRMLPHHGPARRALFGASDPEGGEPTGARVAQFIFFISLFLARLLLMQNLRCARGRRRNECESRKTSDLSGDPY